jgi:para-nitrobenzyl esterase
VTGAEIVIVLAGSNEDQVAGVRTYARILIAWAAMSAALGGAFAVSAAASPAPPASAALIVATADGRLRGHAEGEVVSFKGVPFAAPPVGPLRWHAPEPVKPWTGVRDARQFGSPCAQAALGWNDAVAAQSREDCLYLNVWVPAHHDGAALPVMVFFHGGAYHGGSARGLSAIEPSYDGAKLARRGVIVVTANYRLGLFGFLVHPELSAESPHHASGNYALMDNIAALNWVKANIARFGGDPNNVTIFGQSAGAFSVGFLMTSPLAKGLFAKAIAHSGTVLAHNAIRPDLSQAEAAGAKFVRGLGAPAKGAIAALRLRSTRDLLETMIADPKLHDVEPRDPVVDGYVLPEQPARVFETGREAPVPLIVGNTARDGDLDSMGVSGTPKADATLADRSRPLAESHRVAPLTAKDAKAISAYYTDYPDLAEKAVKTYAATNAAAPADGDAITAFDTDIYFRCAASLIAKWHARIAPTWRFEFAHGYEPLGAVHLWDMFYVFGWLKPPADQPRDAELVDQIERYWTQFARTGNPQTKDLPAWPKFGAQGAYMDFASAGAVRRNGLRIAACDLFAKKTGRDLAARSARKKMAP